MVQDFIPYLSSRSPENEASIYCEVISIDANKIPKYLKIYSVFYCFTISCGLTYVMDRSLNGPMILYPRVSSPIDFSTHAPKVIMREKVLTAPSLTLLCSVPNRGAVGTVSFSCVIIFSHLKVHIPY